MNPRLKKIIFLILTVVLLTGVGLVQRAMNMDRDRLGLTHNTAVLQNAPPVLAFTTVALGGFRGLISNLLWARANDLQQDDKFFEAAQLASWITTLEPHFSQVWVFQGWNMAYNISVKFKENGRDENGSYDYSDRWRWVQRGIELMRDEGLKYNPNDILIFRELAWQFQHKMGANLDDANMFYKKQWALEMGDLFGPEGTNYQSLVHPQTPMDVTNVAILTGKFKMEPAVIQETEDHYGPLDWRLPEAHAIYWAVKGLDQARLNPGKVKSDDLITLRRIIYQSIYQAFKHGRVVYNRFTDRYTLGPNLDLVGRVNDAYESMFAEETQDNMRGGILKAQRNFLRDAIYFLYENNRLTEAAKWFKYLGDKFPNLPIVENDPNSLPKNLTLDDYAVAVVQIDIGETSQERVTAAVQGMVVRAFLALVADEDSRYQNYLNLAQRIHNNYTKSTAPSKGDTRIPLPSMAELKRQVVDNLLDSKQGLPPAARAILRTRLGLPAEAAPAPAATNAPAAIPLAPTPPATNPPVEK